MKSGVRNWGRVPALGCEPTFIADLADAVIESLPYVGAMAVSNLEARQVSKGCIHQVKSDPYYRSRCFIMCGFVFLLKA